MKVLTKNKAAYFEYEIGDTREAGIVLRGHEVKAIKSGRINIKDAVVHVDEQEARVYNMDIPLYKKADPQTVPDYEPKGKRKLLLHKREIGKIRQKTRKTGLRILPLKLVYTKGHRIKLEIGLGKRKKKAEKRRIIKERDTKRMMDKEIKNIM